MTGKAVRRLMALAVCAVLYAGCGPQSGTTPPSPPAEEDPVTRISVPGAYGVPGGDQILQPARQTGALYYGNSFTFRILDPSTLTVVSLSGIPRDMKEGSCFSLYYRLSRDGKTLQSEKYENVKILMANDSMAWLKYSESVFFVIDLL